MGMSGTKKIISLAYYIGGGRGLFLTAAVLFMLNCAGCASVTEMAKGLAGISTRALEEARAGAVVKEFNQGYVECYGKTKEALGKIGAYIYAENEAKKMIAIYVSKEDTTPVGLFFTEMDKATTRVEVSSRSTYAKELISEDVFAFLEGRPIRKELEEDENE